MWSGLQTVEQVINLELRCDHAIAALSVVWFLQNRALALPTVTISDAQGQMRRNDTETFFDPYDKTPRLSSLPTPSLPSSAAPQWAKAESKRAWMGIFRHTLKRSDPDAEPEIDHLRVDISSLHSSGASTPGGRHTHAGLGSGSADAWDSANVPMTNTERKVVARENYKALKGRKARSKRKMGGEYGSRDRGGADDVEDDSQFSAPF